MWRLTTNYDVCQLLRLHVFEYGNEKHSVYQILDWLNSVKLLI